MIKYIFTGIYINIYIYIYIVNNHSNNNEKKKKEIAVPCPDTDTVCSGSQLQCNTVDWNCESVEQIVCDPGSDCEVHCNGGEDACYGIAIDCSQANSCHLICQGHHSCSNVNLQCPDNAECLVECLQRTIGSDSDGGHACHELTITGFFFFLVCVCVSKRTVEAH